MAPLSPVPSGIFLISAKTASRLLTCVNESPAGSMKSASYALISSSLAPKSTISVLIILKPEKKLVFYKLYPPFRG